MKELLTKLDIQDINSGCYSGRWHECDGDKILESTSPIDGKLIAKVKVPSKEDYEEVVGAAMETFLSWRSVPAPKRGLLVRDIGDELRAKKELLGRLITVEMGKILPEGLGEVQEAIDIADFAVGLSRQLYGKTMHSEREGHRMYEQWHPLGPIGVITAFNFPVAVWSWNAMIAAVCGDTVIWKPSEITPITSIALCKICSRVAKAYGFPGLFSLVIDSGDAAFGKAIASDKRIPLVSATGSCRMGRAVAESVAARLGRSLLELGGNNAIIVTKNADLDLCVRAVLFGAVGTAGQRCTTTRRILIEKPVADSFLERLKGAYSQITIGNPLDDGVLMGPLVHHRAVECYKEAIERIKKEGGEIAYGGEALQDMPSGCYVMPTIVKAKPGMEILNEETFAPILYIIEVDSLDDAIKIHNNVPQGLSSAIFTENLKEAERFLSCEGSDCGIANVNIGTSGAEIGGAFGGEKDTGGGRESGSDSWKQYMRRQTCTINYSDSLPLAQGIKFE
ncbi:MAG: aldehyde dehydrogenase family protein [Candidatus Dadabacteria bacterium]|nr:MAG: aldehyde dehydrogenase family protein [Candidatus Dadabacteria bacterium]